MGKVVLALVGLLAVGCGKDVSNVGACKRFVAKLSSLNCLGDGGLAGDGGDGGLDPDRVCPKQLNDVPCDVSAYYDCITAHTSCAVGGQSAEQQCANQKPGCASQP